MGSKTRSKPILLLKILWRFRKSAIIILTPLLLLPLPIIGGTQVANCIFMLALVAVYWTTEACPLAVTSLIPAVLSTLFGMQDAKTVAMNYMKPATFLVIGTFIICIAVEETGLHRRMALRVLLLFGTEPRWILLGIMTITGFLSMWLMNMPTASLMLPITIAVCDEIEALQQTDDLPGKTEEDAKCEKQTKSTEYHSEKKHFLKNANTVNDEIEVATEVEFATHVAAAPTFTSTNIKKAMLLGMTYSSTIGGLSTIVGTPTNMIALGIYRDMYDTDNVNFLTWLSFSLPISVIGMIITWVWVQIRFWSIRDLIKSSNNDKSKKVRKLLRKIYNDLPPISFAESVVGIFFLILMILWVSRDPRISPGWGSLMPNKYTTDATTALFIWLFIFLFPSQSSSFTWITNFWKNNDEDSLPTPAPPLLDWKTFQAKFPWDLLLLIGAAFALAEACVDSGLSQAIGHLLANLTQSPQWVIILAVSTLTSLATEFASNAAMTSILLPILLPMAENGDIHPTTILLAVALSASFAFALPIATPCNALVFSVESITIPDMLWTGIPMNIVFVALLNFLIPAIGVPIFGLDEWQSMNTSSPTTNSTLAT